MEAAGCAAPRKGAMAAPTEPLLLCPANTCLMPSNAAAGTQGSLASFFVCFDAARGTSQGASTWLPETGPAALAAFRAAGFHSGACGLGEDACSVCSWLVPNALPTRALAHQCAVCNGVVR